MGDELDVVVVEGTLEWWHWYCRICAAKGKELSSAERDRAAERHRDDECPNRNGPRIGAAEAGHTLHVWRY